MQMPEGGDDRLVGVLLFLTLHLRMLLLVATFAAVIVYQNELVSAYLANAQVRLCVCPS